MIANLAEFGWLDKMCYGPFSIATFPEAHAIVTKSIFKYLLTLGLISVDCKNQDHFVVSDLGRSVFTRYGSFCILNSYESFFRDLGSLLFIDSHNQKPVVNRSRNVLGSGQLHSRKYFSPALQMLAGRSFPFLVDLGCGNGQFLQQAVEGGLTSRIAGVDNSPIALRASAAKLGKARPEASFQTVEVDACRVQVWSERLPWYREAGLFSLWFVLHEFSQHAPEIVLEFLREVRARYPAAELIIGELVRVPEEALTGNSAESIMPEFLLFHELSNQGVLSWTEWQGIGAEMPFKIIAERHFDNILAGDGGAIPSSFIWHLAPL
jgi:SAM-dependent methyltransferase